MTPFLMAALNASSSLAASPKKLNTLNQSSPPTYNY